MSLACFDILSSGAITNLTKKEAEKLWSSDDDPWSPDFLAFFITLLMMMIFFKGVKKSVMFNHIMNAINLLGCIGLYLSKSIFYKRDFAKVVDQFARNSPT